MGNENMFQMETSKSQISTIQKKKKCGQYRSENRTQLVSSKR